MKRKYFIISFSSFLLACQTPSTPGKAATIAAIPETNNEVDFSVTDSAELLYYYDRTNQKEFKTFWIKDTAFLNTMARHLSVPETEKAQCAPAIKMYLFNNGEVFKTVYAAVEPGCRYLAYAVNGAPRYYPLTNQMQQALQLIIFKTAKGK